ncbi:hypothetical protein H2201_003929 [Coniosporium apollinis]|uniref:Uncharacterized protein n=1 Tax=Coniosporium apollinis TaxID=61459 RepID=A0ABQ9NW98_9PEZI|nr:hypothetical protein H2201_003929 [Coniosporium apollinis]
MNTSNIAKHYARIISLWPKDLLRPTVSFQAALQKRIPQDPASSSSSSTHPTPPREASVPLSKSPIDPKAEERNINALYSLLDNRYSKKYPVSDSLLKPKSNPTYYDDLIRELEQAPDRNWFQRTLNKWKGFLRLS